MTKSTASFWGWGENEWGAAGFRAVPGAIARKSAYIAPGVVLIAVICELGRLCRYRHDGGHMGLCWVLRPNRQKRALVWGCRHRWRS